MQASNDIKGAESANADLPDEDQKSEAVEKTEEDNAVAATNEAAGNSNSSNQNIDLMELLARHLQASLGISVKEEEKREPVIEEFNLKGIAKYIQLDKCKNIIVMTGAGVSTSAGIPDFRTPGTGLYDNLSKYNLPRPQSIFEINFFRRNPEPFFRLAKELYPGNFKPTVSHFFIKLLENKQLLLRNFTQNIDGLEIVAGVSPDLLVCAHGSFHTSHCLECKHMYSAEWAKAKIFKDEVPKCSDCDGVVKPDIVFFGESLPSKFFECVSTDFKKCDLLIVMGTSLVVQPFASLIDRVPDSTPRLLINKEKCGVGGWFGGFDFDSEMKYRDVAHLTTCDDACFELAELLGWKDDLNEIIENTTKKSKVPRPEC